MELFSYLSHKKCKLGEMNKLFPSLGSRNKNIFLMVSPLKPSLLRLAAAWFFSIGLKLSEKNHDKSFFFAF